MARPWERAKYPTGRDSGYYEAQQAARAQVARRRRFFQWVIGTVAGTLLGVLVVGAIILVPKWIDSANERRGRGDSAVAEVDDEGATVIQFPDRFSSVAHKCDDHGHRVFVTTKSDNSRFMVVVDDPSCAR